MNRTVKQKWGALRDRARPVFAEAKLRLRRGTRGIAAVEFALTLPMWVLMLLGASDGAYCLLVNERVDRIAYSVTDIVTQYQTVTKANLNDILLAAGQLMSPLPFANNGVVIISSVFQPATGNPIVEWQYSGGGSLVSTSQIGTTNGKALLPNGLTLNANDNVIISEVYYKFTPMFLNAGIFTQNTVYRVAVYKPRLSPLVTPPT
ncbi:MAG: TadE/TadG family type IV pilus assembly protein [Alphaproteobacteria bacterium]|nr:TadE/TadG family type IV pilus assembly protein [Alphaproteobacteria bacterium]